MFYRKERFIRKTPPYFLQQLRVVWRGPDRVKFLCDQSTGQNVLHFGCADWPIFNPQTNLHLRLAELTKSLLGFDTQPEGLAVLRSHDPRLRLSNSFESLLSEDFDLLLVPEVLEHVGDASQFLHEIQRLKFKRLILTVPDAYSCRKNFFYDIRSAEFLEIVHPDHNCWYTPSTLRQLLAKYSDLVVDETFLVGCSTGVIAHPK